MHTSDYPFSSSLPNETHTIWAPVERTFLQRPLTVKSDVCIVGAGIAGLTTAYQLKKRGVDVIVVDAQEQLGGETFSTSAHLSCVLDDGMAHYRRNAGVNALKKAVRSHAEAIKMIGKICEDLSLSCGFRRVNGCLFSGEEADRNLEAELETAHKIGLPATYLSYTPISSLLHVPCVQFSQQAEIEPHLYITGLFDALKALGVRIYGGTRISSHRREGDTLSLVAQDGFVECNSVVYACNIPPTALALHWKVWPHRTYVIAIECTRGDAGGGLFWDTESPYHYVRSVRDNPSAPPMLLVGGEDHPTGEVPEHPPFEALEAWARKRFSRLGAVKARWSGQVVETLDGLALIGRLNNHEKNVYVATGDSGMGLTHGTVAGLLLSDLIVQGHSEWQDIYSPTRFLATSIPWVLNRNAHLAANYTQKWISKENSEGSAGNSRFSDASEIQHSPTHCPDKPGVCSHLGGTLKWNEAEGTWDCNCHGSRFDQKGTVLNGPATKNIPMKPVAIPQPREADNYHDQLY